MNSNFKKTGQFLARKKGAGIFHEQSSFQYLYQQTNLTNSGSPITAPGLVPIAPIVGSSAFETITLHLVNRLTFLLLHSISVANYRADNGFEV